MSCPLLQITFNEDGPFTYQIGYGRRGVDIDSNGVIKSIPIPFISEGNDKFNIAVDVDNGRNTRIEFSVDLNVQAGVKTISPNL